MFRSALSFLLAIVAFNTTAQSDVVVEVELSRPRDGGSVRIALCKGRTAFEKVEGCHERSMSANGPVVELTFTDLPPGEYAIKALHDVNDNKDMDYTMIGMPKEPYGFSNNAMGTFGPPDFDQAKIELIPGTNTVRLRMRN